MWKFPTKNHGFARGEASSADATDARLGGRGMRESQTASRAAGSPAGGCLGLHIGAFTFFYHFQLPTRIMSGVTSNS